MDLLSEEQQRLIEENRRKALEKLAARKAGEQQHPISVQQQHFIVPIQQSGPASADVFAPFVPQVTAAPQPAPAPIVQQTYRPPPPVPKSPVKPIKVPLKFELESADSFTSPHSPHVNDIFKAIPGSQFFPQDRQSENKRQKREAYWKFPLKEYQSLVTKLEAGDRPSGPNQIPDAVLKLFANPNEIAKKMSKNSFDLSMIDEKIRTSLFPFQRDGVQMALARGGRIILADDMGLGKSIQSLAIASYYRREWPLLIISPASMVSSWHEQVQRWFPAIQPAQINAVYDGKASLNGLVNIGSYDLLTKMSDALNQKKFQVIIVDESHCLKNPDTKRSKALIPVISKASRAILLSGTPALSRPVELFPQIKAVTPKLFNNYYEFGKRYCNGHQTPFGWDFRGASNTGELQLILENTIMIRRVKADVLSQLPPKIRQQVYIKINPKDQKMFAAFNNKGALLSLDDLSGMEARNELMDFWRKTGETKAQAMLEYIEDLLEAGHKCLVFAHHKNVLDVFEDAFLKGQRQFIRIDGQTNSSSRQEICNKFQSDPSVRVALLSITAANTGLTLTAATTVVFAELYWNPGQMVQAEDRAHRIGQCDSVNVHYLLAKGTTDDTLWPLILKKLNTLESVGLGKNDFKGIVNREHDPDQMTLEKCWKKPRLEFDESAPPQKDDDIIIID